ncbi:shikimate dehydrogenase [Liquorilactobacillus satsumensis]|uniref:shikimate dehydrogenase n=1 Tax=Liquorilactobacillus satsumensis TaxID=259059 RepID=UPI0021C3CE61|nr:shikimate dehydrogenase [Liquorilactobacillus satsumensis]MCP9328750.1 shikimate dehydrogenase [Liquorilactobacillus satsumensis]
MEFNGNTELYGFIAHPAHHSLSPLMHNLSFQKRKINACYLAFDIQPPNFATIAASFRAWGLSGANVSMPYKQQFIPYLDELTPRAQRINAVNTIKNTQGRLTSDSTDGAGLFADLKARGFKTHGKTAMILGAGGAGRAIIAAAADYNLQKVFVCKRPNQTFAQTAAWLETLKQQTETDFELLNYQDSEKIATCLQESELLVNATNVGMDQQHLPLAATILSSLSQKQFVYDIIYQPLETPLLKLAAAHGCQCSNGIGMLLWQGALAFEFWTGQTMPVTSVKQALLAEIRRRTI